MILGFVVFGLFLCVLLGGLVYILRLDINEPDTEQSLAFKRRLTKIVVPYRNMGIAIKQANEALIAFAQAFNKPISTKGQ